MRKEYIIKDARKILAEQKNNSGTPERNVMDENPITMSKGLSAAVSYTHLALKLLEKMAR